jgi:hypothetical protein
MENGLSTREEFSVWLFFPDEMHVAECQWVDAKTAVSCFNDVIRRPAARGGFIRRVIITDGGDYTIAEWQYGRGLTFPPAAALN